jgi:hypothetical protein
LSSELGTGTLLAVNPSPAPVRPPHLLSQKRISPMQPRFPADHHFHRRHRNSQVDRARSSSQPPAAADYLIRQCLPAFDASDPRGAA